MLKKSSILLSVYKGKIKTLISFIILFCKEIKEVKIMVLLKGRILVIVLLSEEKRE